MRVHPSTSKGARRMSPGPAPVRVVQALVAAAMLAGQVLGPAPVSAAANSSIATPAGLAADLGDALQSAVQGLAGVLGLNAVSDTSPAPTHDISPSTPWTVFVGRVGVVGGNLAVQQTDLAIPSVGFGTSVSRTYNSTAAGRTGAFGVGWYWTYGVHLVATSGSVALVREDGRTDTYTGSGPVFTPPGGIYDQLLQNADSSFTLTRHDQVAYQFSSSGQLQQVIDPNGNTLRLSYTGGLPTSLTDTAGRTWTIQTDGSGRIASITDPAQRSASYQYNSSGDLTQVSDALGGSIQYVYDVSHHLTRLIDQSSHTTSYAYDGQGRVAGITDAANNTSSVGYDTVNRQTTLTDPLQHVHVYTFDAANRVTIVLDGLGRPETSTWDASNNRVAVSDRNTHTTQYTYDAQGNVTLVVDAASGQSQASYDAANRPLSKVDALQRTTTYRYDAKGNLLTLVAPTVNGTPTTTTFTYDARGQQRTATDTNNHNATFGYDSSGNQVSAIDALNQTTSRTFDTVGRVLTETDPDGRTTAHTYDALGRVLSTTDGSGGTSNATYDAVGNRLTSADALGHTTTFTYDVRDLLTRATDAQGDFAQTTYDAVGNKTSVTDPLGHRASFLYDANNRLLSATDPNNLITNYSYDPVGNQLTTTDPLARTTTFDYDVLNRLARVTDPLGGRATYAYDAVGNRTSTTDPNDNTSTSTFDSLDRLASQTDADSASLAFAYDPIGNLLKKTDGNNQITTYGYDAANRLQQANYPEGTVSYTYDGAGDRVRMSDPILGTTSYSYDGARRLTSTATSNGSTSYVYDRAGNLSSVSYPQNGGTVSYAYDALNRVVSVTDPNGLTSGFSYDAAGRKATASQPNGTRGTFTYDAGGRVTAIQWTGPNGSSVLGLSYGYDDAGNTTQVVDGTGTNAYGYDRLDRLTQSTYSDGSGESFAYDPAGNRTNLSTTGPGGTPGSTTFYTYNKANRLQNVGDNAVSFDGNGNQKANGATAYQYDSQNRLLQVKTPTQVLQMAYDGASHRVTYSVAGAATTYSYDEHSSLARVLTENNTTHAQLYGLDGQILWDNTSDKGLLYYHQDALGSSAALTRPDGAVAGTRSYKAFGEPRSQTGQLTGSFWFAGEQLDPETGLIYLRARYYDPATGRFLQSDPAPPLLRNTQSLNRYIYANNNPLRFTDPSGEIAPLLFALVIFTVAVLVPAFTNPAQVGDDAPPNEEKRALTELITNTEKLIFSMYTDRIGAESTFEYDRNTGQLCAQDVVCAGITKNTPASDSGRGPCLCTTPPSKRDPGTQEVHITAARVTGRVAQTSNQSNSSGRSKTSGGAYQPAGRPPNRPGPDAPYNWFVTIGSPPTLQWHDSGSPDGRPIVASKVWIFGSGGCTCQPYIETRWLTGRSYTPQGLPYLTFGWVVQVMDDRGLVSDMSDAWNFSVANPVASIDPNSIQFLQEPDGPIPASTNELIGIKACTTGRAGLGISMTVMVNAAPDGSSTGTWNIIKQLGVPCFDTGTSIDHPEWYTLAYADGPHLVRIIASKQGVDLNNPSAIYDVKDVTYTLPHRRPAAPKLVAPLDGTYLNTRSLTFQWGPTTNATGYRLRASTNVDPTVTPFLDVALNGSTLSYPTTVPDDFPAVYWRVTASNDVGTDDSPTFRFGVDRAPPTSSVSPLSAQSAQTNFLVRWSSADSLSGVKCTNVQVRDGANGGWADWFGCTTTTFALFQGQDGHAYFFRARATDLAGNQGAFTTNADGDATITVNVAAATVWWNGAYLDERPISVLNNASSTIPAGYVLRLRLDGTTTPTAQQIYDSSQSANKCDDIRVVYQNATELDRLVITCSSTAIDLLFRAVVPINPATLDNTSYELYYHNPAPATPPVNRNAVLYPAIDGTTLRAFDMLENGGLTLRDSSLHADASMNPALGWSTPGKFGPAVVIPGDLPGGPAITGPGDAQPPNAFTVEFWMKRTASYGGSLARQVIGGSADCNSCWALELQGDQLVFTYYKLGSANASRTFGDSAFFSAFHHLAVTFDGANAVRFYVDGQLDVSRTLQNSLGGLSTGGVPLRIGADEYGANRFGGQISGFAFSSVARTDFSYAQYAAVDIAPTTAAGAEAVLTTPLPTPTPTPTASATPTVPPNVVDPGTGADGPLVVTGTLILSNHPTTAIANGGSSTLALGDATGYASGDEIFVHQTRGDGRYELARVQAVVGNTLTLRAPLVTGYSSGAQVVRVPNYTDLTIGSGGVVTAAPWDGSRGGLLVVHASGTVRTQSNGAMDVSGLGYLGGTPQGSCNDGDTAQQGEGATGIGTISTASNTNGGGGGRRTALSGGGGGGGYGTAGGGAQFGSAAGGAAVGTANLSTLLLGGGGGGSACNGAPGATGAGAVFVVAPTIVVDSGGAVRANGSTGSSVGGGPGSGGGAGGAIFLRAGVLQIGANQVQAQGGAGSAGGSNYGGSGGVGRIHLESVVASGTTYPVADTSTLQVPTPLPTATPTITSTPTPTLSPPSYRDIALGDSPVAYWRLDEPAGSSSLADATGNGHAATPSGSLSLGAPGLIANDPDTAAAFDGGLASAATTSDFTFNATDSFSIEGWVRTTTADGTLFSQYGCTPGLVILSVGSAGKGDFRIRGTSDALAIASGGPMLTDGRPHHVVGVRDATTSRLRLYVDGAIAQDVADTTSGGLTSPGTQTGVGQSYPCPVFASPLRGTLDEVAVYRTALSSNQVTAHYRVGVGLAVTPTPIPTVTPTPTITPTPTVTPTGTPTPKPFAFGTGADGDKRVSSSIDLNPVRAVALGTAGSSTLSISGVTGAGFASGQVILIHQTRGPLAGVWELNGVQTVSGAQLVLQTPLSNSYVTDTGASRAQVLWVPQYRTFSVDGGIRIQADAWDGNTGGILAFMANDTATIAGAIESRGNRGWQEVPGSGAGFRGGAPKPHGPDNGSGGGETGEGTGGDPVRQTAANTSGGGGGFTYGQYGGSGGGGSHASPGASGNQDNSAIAGAGATTLTGAADLSAMTFGGGGGGAAIDGAGTIGAGGAGGGIALIFARNLSVTNTGDVSADGGFGDSENYGGGGGGAGGSIFIRSQQASLATNLVTAQGGVGGNKPASNPGWDGTWTTRPGGDGGDGRIHIESCAPISGSTAPSANTKIDLTLCTPPTPTPTATVTSTPSATPTVTPTATLARDLVWSGKTSMPTARNDVGVTAAPNGFIYAAGGASSNGDVAAFEQYDPVADVWQSRASLPTARRGPAVVSSGGKIYAIGGCQAFPCSSYLGDVEQYDPFSDSWTTRAPMPTGRDLFGAALATNGKVYAVGGYTASGTTGAVEEYDPSANVWRTRASLPTPRYALAVVAGTNGRVYAVGGVGATGHVATVEEYDPASDTWRARTSMPASLAYLATVAAANGRLYTLGGSPDFTTPVSTVDEYDPSTDIWTVRASLPTARYFLGAALGSNGQMYAIGGAAGSGSALPTVEDAIVPSGLPEATPTSTPTPTATPSATATATASPTATATFQGRIALPGRGSAPNASWQVVLQLSFLQPNSGTRIASATPTTDSSGQFVVTNLQPGTYDVELKMAQGLSKLAQSVVLTAGTNPVRDFGQIALGDINGDDAVDLLDFSSLRATFGKCVGDPGYDARADLNGDGCIDLLDFSLLRASFGQVGPQLV